MLCDRSDLTNDVVHATVCVVGAGPIGISVAVSLARAGVATVLLESGGDNPDLADSTRFGVEFAGRHHNGCQFGRFQAFGGTSTKWGGQLLPLGVEDFARRPWVAQSGWPINAEELAHFEPIAAAMEGIGTGIASDAVVWQRLGMTQPDYGTGLLPQLARWCPEPDFGRIYRKEISRSSSLACIRDCTVVCFDCDGDKIRSAICRSHRGSPLRVVAKEFVLCAGAIETARVLMQAQEDGQPAPWSKTTMAIGRYFMDHPTFQCADVTPVNPQVLHKISDMIYLGGQRYLPRFRLSPEIQAQDGVLNAGGTLVYRSDLDESVISQVRAAARQLVRQPLSMRAWWTATVIGGRNLPFVSQAAWRYVVHRRAHNPDGKVRLLAFIEQAPDPKNRFTLTSEKDSLGMHKLRLDWKIGDLEAHTVRRFASQVKVALESKGLAKVELDSFLQGSTKEVTDRCWDNYHHIGTARMASSPEDGVVDKDLKVFGSRNCHVCSCAVFPTSGFANPTHTALVLAMRWVDTTLRRLGTEAKGSVPIFSGNMNTHV